VTTTENHVPENVDEAIEAPYHDALEALAPKAETQPADKIGLLRRFWLDLRSVTELRRTPYGMRPVLILALISMFQIFDAQAFRVAAPFIVRESNGEIGVTSIIDITSLVAGVGLFVALALGWWADRHRRVPLLAVGTIVDGIGAAMAGFGRSTVSYGIPRVAAQVGQTAADVPSFSLLADYYPPDARGRVFAFLGTASRLAQVGAVFGVGVMIEFLGVSRTLFILGIPIVVSGLIALVVLREPIRGYFERKTVGTSDDAARAEDEPLSFGEGWRTTFSVRTVRRLFIADIFSSFPSLISLFVLFFYAEEYGLSPWEISLAGLPSLVVAIVGGVYGGGLVDRFSRTNPGRVLSVFAVFNLIAAVQLVGLALSPPLWVLIVASAVSSFGLALVGPALSSVYSQVIPPNIRTQGLQVTNLAALSGILVGNQVLRSIFVSYGYETTFLSAIPFILIAAAIYATAGSFFEIDRRNAFAKAVAADEWRRAQEAGSTKLLVCRNVDVAYEGVQVLFDVDLDVEEGEIIALLGTNGAGKSTLLRAICGTQEASNGAIVFDGRDITHMPPHEIAARGVVQMPGGKGIFPGLTVRENLELGNWLADDLTPAEIRARLQEVFEIFPVLRQRADAQAGLLSGGEQQQLSLAQAFLMRPRLLLIDELSLGLSPAVVGQLLDVVREIHRRGVTIIVVEQSVNVALNLATRAIFMEKGEVKFDGATEVLLGRPDILRAVYVKGTGAIASGSGAATRSRRELELSDAQVVLEASDLVKRYGGVTAVNGVSLTLRDGEVLGLVGPNGSGKTTLFDLISGFQLPDSGNVILQGRDVSRMSPEDRAALGLVRRFQDAKLFPSLTVFETLLISLEQRLEVKSTLLSAASAPRARRAERRLRARAEKLIELMGLESYRDKFVKELSTGLRRIVDIACVLAAEPKVLLLDEPSSGIAQAEAEGLAPLLRRIRFETGCSILIIEHDMPLISAVSDELIALEQGTFVTRGTPDDVLNDERVVQAYLGGSEAAINRSGRVG
jgi:ABC-type branched-subunit amino acid transport system ATPase component/MFS family permease